MRVSLVRSVAIAAGLLTAFFGPLAIDSGLSGIAPAQAKEYYTKKRVNGRWINGRFAKRGAVKAKVAARSAPVREAAPRAAAVRVAEAKTTSTAAAPTPAASAPAPAAMPARVEGNGSPQATSAAPAAATPLADDGRMRQLQEALQARTQSLLVTSLAPTSAATPTATPIQPLQEALQARSRNILVTSLVDPAPVAMDLSGPSETASLGPVRAVAPRAEIRSVTFDFVSGVKSTLFGDGTTATEAFDTRSMQELASRRSPPVN